MRERALHHINRAKEWYGKYEGPISSGSLIFGFVFDAVTLKRVDMFWENFWILIHLLAVAICIIFINKAENKGSDAYEPGRLYFWLINTLQFAFGGLLSVFLVFYFRSAVLVASWPFFILLGAAFVANERFKRHYERLSFQISLFFLSLFSFSIFIVPVLVHSIGPWVFILSGLVSLFVLWLFIRILQHTSREKFHGSRRILTLTIGAIFIAINVLYFTNLIPPIPLSLKEGGIYHSITINSRGEYMFGAEDQGFFSFFKTYDDIHLSGGAPLYAYSAIFSPTSLNTRIVHEWQYLDPTSNNWITKSRIPLAVSGGRENGFRTYSTKSNLPAGKWRVNVTTERGQLIGRINFRILSI